MNDILDNLVNDTGSSDNEDIKKLFPKCKPKACFVDLPGASNDFNLNRLRAEVFERYNFALSGSGGSGGVYPTDIYQTVDANENESATTTIARTVQQQQQQQPGQNWSVDPLFHQINNSAVTGSSTPIHQNERPFSCHLERNNFNAENPAAAQHRAINGSSSAINLSNGFKCGISSYAQPSETVSCGKGQGDLDNSVMSAYEQQQCGLGFAMDSSSARHNMASAVIKPGLTSQQHQQVNNVHMKHPQHDVDEVVYDNDLDVGYRMPTSGGTGWNRDGFKLRESRIEIAGGREVFSSSRSRPCKKRYSDEMLYHHNHHHHRPNSQRSEQKRHSREVLYDDQLGRYHVKAVGGRPKQLCDETTSSSSSTKSGLQNASDVCYGGGVEPSRGRQRGNSVHHLPQCHREPPPPPPPLHQPSELDDAGIRTEKVNSVASSSIGTVTTDALALLSSAGAGVAAPVTGDRDQQIASERYRESQRETFVLKGQRGSGMFIYETVMCGTSEVVYDDIGEWGSSPDRASGFGGIHQQQHSQLQSATIPLDDGPAPLMETSGGGAGSSYHRELLGGSTSNCTGLVGYRDSFQRRMGAMSTSEVVSSEDFGESEDGEDSGGGGGGGRRSSSGREDALSTESPPRNRRGGFVSKMASRSVCLDPGNLAAKGEANVHVMHSPQRDDEEDDDDDEGQCCPDEAESSSEDMDTESPAHSSSPDRKPSVARLIGGIPIAQYEGSPRRYGPRPGHPQRVTLSGGGGEVHCNSADLETKLSVVVLPTSASTNNNNALPDSQPQCTIVSKDNIVTSAQQLEMEESVMRTAALNGTSSFTQQSSEEQLEAEPLSLDLDGLKSIKDDGGHGGGPTGTAILPFTMSDYSYQFEESETRKVLEEFYEQDGLCAKLKEGGTLTAEEFSELEYRLYRVNTGNSYVGRRLAQSYVHETEDSPKKKKPIERMQQLREHLLANSIALKGTMTSQLSQENVFHFNLDCHHSPASIRPMHLIPTTDHDGDTVCSGTNPDTTSEDLGETEVGEQVGQSRNFTLSPETTECDSNDVESEVSMENEGSLHSSSRQYSSMPILEDGLSSGHTSDGEMKEALVGASRLQATNDAKEFREDVDGDSDREGSGAPLEGSLATMMMKKQISEIEKEIARRAHKHRHHHHHHKHDHHHHSHHHHHFQQPHVQPSPVDYHEVEEYLRRCDDVGAPSSDAAGLNLDILDPLRQLPRSPPPPPAPHPHRHSPTDVFGKGESVSEAINEIKQAIRKTKSMTLKSPPMEKPEGEEKPVWVMRPMYKSKPGREDGESGREKNERHEDGGPEEDECDTDQETDRLLGKQRAEDSELFTDKEKETQKKKGRTKEVLIHEPAVLIEGVLFRARYLGSTQLVCEGQPTKATRMMQAEEAVSRIKAPEGETQPSTEVDLFISTEKIMVLNTDLKEIMMDHALRTISYIADIGDLVVLMARRRVLSSSEDSDPKIRRTPKMICHVFESEEAQFIAQSIGQAFQVAYMEFLKANGIEDHSFVKEMDYQEVLNSQEIYGDELEMFAKKEMQKEVIVPKLKGEILGVVIVESGWGSMLPTVVIANLSPNGAAARCGQLNIGDQIIAINGISLVGLPLSTCQNYIKNTKNQTVVKLTVVPCAPVVEVKIKRPDTKYQLGFSVQNGVICSLLRGGIAERGGVRVGHRIIEINGQSVVAVPHERIVNLLATSVGEIHMKTMPTSMFRLLTGQESPLFI